TPFRLCIGACFNHFAKCCIEGNVEDVFSNDPPQLSFDMEPFIEWDDRPFFWGMPFQKTKPAHHGKFPFSVGSKDFVGQKALLHVHNPRCNTANKFFKGSLDHDEVTSFLCMVVESSFCQSILIYKAENSIPLILNQLPDFGM